mmetsp:Transcript_6738/g.6007  ORF Transcript_6738/g.6007 Transcript_6738/m.6007 type:complete len:113 (+) Transcript_6738:3-341(+)
MSSSLGIIILIVVIFLVLLNIIFILWKSGYCQCIKSKSDNDQGRHSVMTEQTVQAMIEAMQIKATSAEMTSMSGNETDLLQETRPTKKGDTNTLFAEEDDPDDDNEFLEHHL